MAAEAVAGRPLEKVLRRARRLLDEPGARERLDEVASAEGLEPLAAWSPTPIVSSAAGAAGACRTRPPLATALRSGAARRALRARVGGRLRTAAAPRAAACS